MLVNLDAWFWEIKLNGWSLFTRGTTSKFGEMSSRRDASSSLLKLSRTWVKSSRSQSSYFIRWPICSTLIIPKNYHWRASRKSIIAMWSNLCSCLVTLLLASQCLADFFLNYPPSIVFDDALEGTPPHSSFTPDPPKVMLPTIMLAAPLSPWHDGISQRENLKTDSAWYLSTLKQIGFSAQC